MPVFAVCCACIHTLLCTYACVCVSRVCLCVTTWTGACQAPQSMGFPRSEYWSGLSCPPPEDLPDPGIKPGYPALQADSVLSEPPGKSFIFPLPACPIFPSFKVPVGKPFQLLQPENSSPWFILDFVFFQHVFSSLSWYPAIHHMSWVSSVSVTGKGVMTMRP